ncbi:MAG: Ig-like domain-containing protein [Bacteroidales bacterium]|nr:Ig-like domain-containing protein [Bacteroidales bacterium]
MENEGLDDIIVHYGEDVPVESITLGTDVLELTKGQTVLLEATVNPSGTEVEWTSTDPSVAWVSGGTVGAASRGEAIIVARAGVRTAQCKVTVTAVAQSETIKVKSPSMGTEIETIVVVPGIATGRNPVKCPTVYLLHGAYGKPEHWYRVCPELNELADRYGFIFVIPDGAMSWYMDSPVDASIRYETFTSIELVDYIDNCYPTIPKREKRAITGLSMGGHGSMYNALKHTDTFGAVGSMSGCLDFRPLEVLYGILDPVLGSHETHMDEWLQYTAIGQIPYIKDGEIAIIVDCGSEDFILEGTTLFHDALVAAGISHSYELRPGIHDDDYWHGSIPKHLDFFQNYFNLNE